MDEEIASEIPSSWHRPVLVQEVVQLLAPTSGRTFVDCTVGTGGHSVALLPRLMPTGRLVALDCDEQALERAGQRLTEFRPHINFASRNLFASKLSQEHTKHTGPIKIFDVKRLSEARRVKMPRPRVGDFYVQLIHDRFERLPEILSDLGILRVHGLLADVGMSSLQVDAPERGFSFLHEGPLDMRMDQRGETTAAMLIQRLSEADLATLLEEYGEERWSRRIAKRIVAVRGVRPIRTTTQLAQLIREAVPPHRSASARLHPATRAFLSLRIAVNEELRALQSLLDALPALLEPGGRAAIITFHSLEDRLVKQAFRRGAQEGMFRLLTKKPIRPSDQEITENPRSRSSRLRAVERC